jgi:DNA end-binding protein Ku
MVSLHRLAAPPLGAKTVLRPPSTPVAANLCVDFEQVCLRPVLELRRIRMLAAYVPLIPGIALVMAPRSLWNGTIAFGLVRVPVKLHSATESKTISFRERHVTDGAAIEHRRICVKEDREVPHSEVVKGFEVSAGSYVVLSKEEIAVADGTEAHVIDVEHFVAAEEIDPAYYERSYYLSPGRLGDEAYRMLHAALKRSARVGIGRFVFHNKAHLVAVRALEEVIALHTMRFADEFVPERELDMVEPEKEPTKLEVDTARLLVEQLAASFDPSAYENTYRDAVLGVIERKARGERIEAPEPERASEEGELLGALRASLEQHGRDHRRGAGGVSRSSARAARKRSRTRGGA